MKGVITDSVCMGGFVRTYFFLILVVKSNSCFSLHGRLFQELVFNCYNQSIDSGYASLCHLITVVNFGSAMLATPL